MKLNRDLASEIVNRVIQWHMRRLEDWDALMQQLPPGSEVLLLARHALDNCPHWDTYSEFPHVRHRRHTHTLPVGSSLGPHPRDSRTFVIRMLSNRL